MSPDEYLDAIEREADALADAAAASEPDAPVPSCPRWTVAGLLEHVGRVHRWAAERVTTSRCGAVVVARCRRRGGGPGDVTARGTASDLLLVLWGRVRLDAVDVVGDREVLAHFQDSVRI